VHVLLTTFDPHDATNWTPGYATVRALAEAERMLRRGFTTVRDVGGADHGMARAIDEGLSITAHPDSVREPHSRRVQQRWRV
jgi:imidazolonepropionase-like amidohydrolase